MSTTKQDILTLQAVPQCTGIRESQSRLIHHHKFCKSTAKCVEDVNIYTRHSLVPRPNFMCTSCAWAMERWGLHSLVPRPPVFFCSSVCVQYNAQKQTSRQKRRRPGSN